MIFIGVHLKRTPRYYCLSSTLLHFNILTILHLKYSETDTSGVPSLVKADLSHRNRLTQGPLPPLEGLRPLTKQVLISNPYNGRHATPLAAIGISSRRFSAIVFPVGPEGETHQGLQQTIFTSDPHHLVHRAANPGVGTTGNDHHALRSLIGQ